MQNFNIVNLQEIVGYLIDDELKDLERVLIEEEDVGINFKLPSNTNECIELIETKFPNGMNHIGYNVLLLNRELENYISNSLEE